MVSLSVDAYSQTIWLHSTKHVYFLNYAEEEKDVWVAFMKKGRLKDALDLCTKGSKDYALCAGLYADDLFANGNWERSVEYYSVSNKSFEEVTLKFLHQNKVTYLLKYLENFLFRVKKFVGVKQARRDQFKPQLMMLCTWIIELRISEISESKNAIDIKRQTKLSDGLQESDQAALEFKEKFLEQSQDEFHKFLIENQDSIDIVTLYQTFQNHGQIDECIKFAE